MEETLEVSVGFVSHLCNDISNRVKGAGGFDGWFDHS